MERIYETSAKAEEGGEEKDYCVPGNVGEAGPSQTSELETNKTQPPETENIGQSDEPKHEIVAPDTQLPQPQSETVNIPVASTVTKQQGEESDNEIQQNINDTDETQPLMSRSTSTRDLLATNPSIQAEGEIQKQSSRQKSNTNKSCVSRYCEKALILIAWLSIVIIAAAIFITDLVITNSHQNKNLVVRNNLVLLDANSSGIYSTKITFKNINFTADYIQPNMTTDVYQVPCKQVYHLYESQDTPIIFQPLRVAFNSCGEYNNKCVLDEYWYCSKSDVALMMYAFNFTVKNKEQLIMLVFDDAVAYYKYLAGKTGPDTAMYSRKVPTDINYWVFDFTSARMRKAASYYFFVIADIKGGTETFLLTKRELRTFFNTTMLLPNCKVVNNNSCTSYIGLTLEENCFLAKAKGHVNSSSYGLQDIIYISYKLEHFKWSILNIASLSLGGLWIIVATVLYCKTAVCN